MEERGLICHREVRLRFSRPWKRSVQGVRAFWSDYLLKGDFPLNVFDTIFRGITIIGSIVGTRQDLRECLEFAADFKVIPVIEEVALGNIQSAVDRLQKGDVLGRFVVHVSSPSTALK